MSETPRERARVEDDGSIVGVDDLSDDAVRRGLTRALLIVTGNEEATAVVHELAVLALNMQRKRDALSAENVRLLQSLTDEQEAHKLTAQTLTKAIRDGDKARSAASWAGQVDRMSGAFDPNDRHEMGG